MNYIDSTLTELNNKICPIWISSFALIDKIPEKSQIEKSVKALLAELAFVKNSDKFNYEELVTQDENSSNSEYSEKLINARIELSVDCPIRIGFVHLTKENSNLFYIQLHHAVGDGRSFTFIIERFLELLSDKSTELKKVTAPKTMNRHFVFEMLKAPYIFLLFLLGRFRLSAKRAVNLKSVGQPIKVVKHTGLAVAKINSTLSTFECSKLFYTAVMKSVADNAAPGRVRLRVPIDVRPHMQRGREFGNLCPCINLEMDSKKLQKANIKNSIYNQLKFLYISRAYLVTHIEGLIYHFFIQKKSQSFHDFFDSPRSNSLVVTFMGNMDKVFQDAPFTIDKVFAHTPTWGVIGYTFRGKIIFNLNYFDGVWDQALVENFKNSLVKNCKI